MDSSVLIQALFAAADTRIKAFRFP